MTGWEKLALSSTGGGFVWVLEGKNNHRKGCKALEQVAQGSSEVILPESVPKICGYDTWGHGLMVDVV